jgi:ubiquinone/menaquinone biosynthesis C-methylase UbiE
MNLIKTLKALSDETRFRIFRLFFNGIFNVNEILYIIGGKQSNISHHLKILQDSDLIIGKKEGAQVFYRINDLENGNLELVNFVKKNEMEINHYTEDIKRIEAILEKRKKSAEEYFNSIGEELDNVQAKLFENIYSVESIAHLFGKKMKVIADIGCGTGRNLPVLAKYSEKIIGIDSSPKMINLSEHISQKFNLNYELKIGDVSQIPLSDESLDGIFANMVLHHISEPSKTLKEFSRILVRHGRLLLVDLMSHNDESMREKYADLWLGFNVNEIEKWLSKNNFAVIENLVKKSRDGALKVFVILAEKL